MRIYAIDPGTKQSGWVLYEAGAVLDSGVHDNHELLQWVKHGQGADLLAIEVMQASYGTVGKETIDTMMWAGRFWQAWADPEDVRLVTRQEAKAMICNGNTKASDSGVRLALLDRFPATGGGKVPQVGTKALPGPLYGVSSHAWAALAVAMTVAP